DAHSAHAVRRAAARRGPTARSRVFGEQYRRRGAVRTTPHEHGRDAAWLLSDTQAAVRSGGNVSALARAPRAPRAAHLPWRTDASRGSSRRTPIIIATRRPAGAAAGIFSIAPRRDSARRR